MRIAYLHYLAPTDSALAHVAEFTRAARDLGADVSVHALHASSNRQPDRPGAAGARPRSSLRRFLGRYLHEPREFARNLSRARGEERLVASVRPDVLLVRTRLLTASHVVTARRHGLPLVLEVNAPVLESTTHKRDYAHLPWLPAALERWQLRAADAIVTVSSPLKAHLCAQAGVPPEKVVVVPNGADVVRFTPEGAPAAIPWPMPASGPVVGFVGSFQEFHDVALLARMIVRVGRERPSARFLLVGDASRAETIRAHVRELGDRVYFTGHVAYGEVPAFVRAFDIGVLAATAFYCSPLKVLEWMAAARAIVVPEQPALADLVTADVDALVFPPHDEEALVAAVVALIDDPARRQALGSAARARVLGSFTWHHNAARVLAVCQSVARPSSTAK